MSKYSNILHQADIFRDLSEEQMKLILACSHTRNLDFNDRIFEENSASDELYIIVEGEVEIEIDPALVSDPSMPSAGPSTIATLRRGQCFGEIALVDQGIRSASAKSASPDTILVVFPREDLMKICDSHPDLGYRLMNNLAADLALKIRSTDLRLREHLLYSPRKDT
ncbi:MAG: cyclic nucleotide-binding domain-containing protein [Anaerolineales bacterium]|nr:cyclic nucleotide-binding domain-containing protein [Anaerolineales bacterium]